ncbi:glutathione S-transferase N-terminal domain-containing protein [Gammaproteobacteria bacterium]|nr:glutathione S-transferase N-terminal domain-containing protein [Gammaproteobacteria bacterium]
MKYPILYSFIRCPYAMRARMALKLTNTKCEIREVRLNNKPKQMIDKSPKGTVPVLVLEKEVIDESNDIIEWALSSNNIFEGNLDNDQIDLTNNLIELFDSKFKYNLDRYKYATRYENINKDKHKKECLEILINLENLISNEGWILGSKINKLDISILPFIRQFRIADIEWFDKQNKIKGVQKILFNFLDSNLFKEVMYKYDVWEENAEPQFFP